MKRILAPLALLAVVAFFAPERTNAAVLTVDNDLAQCPTAQFTSIQAAVTAAGAGDTVRVCPGTYAEQVRIDKPLRVMGVEVGNENLALVRPVGVLPNSTSLSSGAPIAAIILVDNAKNVFIENLTVDGATNGINACAPNLVGIYYRNASGRVENMAVREIRLGPGLEGCQSGLGIFAQSGGGGASKLDVLNSTIHDYQKNGITANEAGTDLTARGNTVTGLGPTQFIAQNGIQFAFGARGLAEGNSVINHLYSLCTPTSCGAVSTSVLIFDAGDVRLRKNNLGKSQVNVYLESSGADVSDNSIFDSEVFDGVFVFGDNNKLQNNTIFNSDEAAVFVIGNNNKVHNSTINEAPVGIFEDSPSSGNAYHGNKFYNTEQKIVQPAPLAATMSLRAASAPASARSNSPAQP